jgi:hypothetical protein
MTAPPALPNLVCDTDVASFVVKDDPIRSPRYLPHMQGRSVVMPFSVLAELRLGAELRNWGPVRRARIDQFVQSCRIQYLVTSTATPPVTIISVDRHPERMELSSSS